MVSVLAKASHVEDGNDSSLIIVQLAACSGTTTHLGVEKEREGFLLKNVHAELKVFAWSFQCRNHSRCMQLYILRLSK